MKIATMSVGKAEILLGRLVGLSIAVAVFLAFCYTLEGNGSQIADLLPIMLLYSLPPAGALGLLFLGKRRFAGYVSLLGMVPCIALLLLTIIPLLVSGGSPSRWVGNSLLSLPFFYSTVTLARVAVGVRVTTGKQRRTRRLRGATRRAALTDGLMEQL